MSDVFLGVIAVAVLVMATIQVAVIVFAARTARRVGDVVGRLERDLRPIIANLQAISADAARATSMATAQVEGLDQMVMALRDRLEHTATLLQQNLLGPIRELASMLQALGDMVFGRSRRSRGPDSHRRHPADEEDALFIG